VYSPVVASHVGLICAEAPEAYFEDLLILTNPERRQHLVAAIDPVFLDVCEPGSVQLTALVPDLPCPVGGRVEGDVVLVATTPLSDGLVPSRITVRLTGIRKGLGGVRFARYSAHEAQKNLEFWSSWRQS
jgi:hypothetical protein